MTLVYTTNLGLISQTINVGAQKIDGSALKIYKMVTVEFLVNNNLGKAQFFEKTFSLVDTNIEVVLEMLFLSFSNSNLQFGTKKLL